MTNLSNWIIKICLYLLVFLLPLFWLPFSFEAFEFNKQYLLFFLVSIAFFAWLAKMVLVDKEIRFKRRPLDIFVLAFLFIAILSTIFSVDKGSSLFGFYGKFSDGLVGLLSLAILYFLITNNVGYKISIDGIVKVFLASISLVVLLSYFSIFSLWQRIGLIGLIGQIGLIGPMGPIGLIGQSSLEGLAVFLAVATVLLTGLIISQNRGELKAAKGALLLAILGLLIIIDFGPAWVVLLVSLSLFLVLAIGKRIFREKANKLLLPLFLVLVAVIFLVSTTNFPGRLALPQERILGQGISWATAFGGASENIKAVFLGSGIGTFHYDFAKFKPATFNLSPFWQLRFDRPGSHLAEILGTMGFLGLISYLALIGIFLLVSWFLIKIGGQKSQIINSQYLPLLMTFVALVVSQFVYYQNTTLAFAFWLVLGLTAVSWERPISELSFSFKNFPELNLVATALLIVIGLTIATFYYFAQQFYRADIVYGQSQKMALGSERRALLEKAVKMNPYFPQYQIILARSYLQEIQNEMRKPVESQDLLVLQANIAKAIETARRAVDRAPRQVAAVETQAMVYRDIRLAVAGSLDWAIKSFEKAILLEPANPVLRTELGKLYLEVDEIEKAKEQFGRAKELKPDYFDALIQEALVFERENNLAEAIRRMEKLSQDFPLEREISFQLGRLYFNAGRTEEAISQLKKVVEVFPNHSNALYSLGAAYQRKGEKEKAREYFEKVLELNPGNQDIINKLKELQ